MSYFDISLNCSPKCEAWEDILDHYGEWISDDEVWEYARHSEECPILGNVYQHLLLNRVLSHFCEETGCDEGELDLFVFINSIDTHLMINNWDICSIEDYWGCVEQQRAIH